MDYTDLHDYQRFSIRFITEKPEAALFLDCGLGKTVTTLTAIDQLMFDSFEVSKVLVICPLRVGTVWADEVQKWSHLNRLKVNIAIGTESERLKALRSPADIHIINRENVQWLVENSRVPWNWDCLILDESSSFKNHQSKRFKSLMRVRPKASRVVLLSATPAANNLMDLWAQFRLLDMGERLGRFIGKYRTDYFLPDKRNGQVIFSYKSLPDAEEEIYKRISDITISMKATDHLRMPELITVAYPVRLNKLERGIYERLKQEMVLSVTSDEDGEITAANAATLAGKLCQMANGAVYDDSGAYHCFHDRKLDALEDLIEAANGKPVLVAYWFKHDLERISARLKSKHIPFSKMDTADSITKWNNGELPVALIHPASAGHGLNLQAGGSTIIWFGLTWSLELYQQTNARLWRQGQAVEMVVIHHIIAENTIDERIMKALSDKDRTQSSLMEAVKANL